MSITTKTFENFPVKENKTKQKTPHPSTLQVSMGVGVSTQSSTFTKGYVCSGVTVTRDRLNVSLFLGPTSYWELPGSYSTVSK